MNIYIIIIIITWYLLWFDADAVWNPLERKKTNRP